MNNKTYYESKFKEFLKTIEKEEFKEAPWKSKLIRDDKGKYINSIDNYIIYFSESDKYKGKLRYNEFLKQKEFNGREWNDFDEYRAGNDIEHEIGLSNVTKVKAALMQVFDEQRYDPVKDYLNNVIWDGKERISEIFIKCFDVFDTELVRTLSKKWFIAAVKRVFEPGCQFDNMIVLQGESGIGKTTFCRLLSNNFYSEVKFDEIDNKDIVDKLNKSWIVILDEMDNFGKKQMASIKSFLFIKKDVVRLAFGKNTSVYYRHSIFIGSLNDETFLRDITSSVERRFWVFKCLAKNKNNNISKILTKDTVDQLWAEAVYYYKEDPDQYLDVDSEMQEQFAEDQKQYKTYNDDIYIDYLKDILDKEYVLVNGEFNDNNDFLHQYNDTNVLGNKSYINKIPMSSLIYVLKNVYKDTRNSKFVAIALSDEWDYKVIKYKGKCVRGLMRKERKTCTTVGGEIDENSVF